MHNASNNRKLSENNCHAEYEIVKWTEYIGKMSVDRQILMFSEIRFNILFRIARARYSDILDGHEHRKED